MAEEEFEHDERIANWAAIQNLVEDDAMKKESSSFLLVSVKGPGQ
jgi:hypothetical protein